MAKKWFLTLAAVLALCSCNEKSDSKSYNFAKFSKVEANYTVADDYPITLRQVKQSDKWNPMTSTGEQRMLVIPVQFTDFTCDIKLKDYGGCDKVRSDIQAVFFGSSEDTIIPGQDPDGWESVSSFYSKTSYGKLNITGVVSPWYTYEKSAEELTKNNSSTNLAQAILYSAVEWYKGLVKESQNNPNIPEEEKLTFDFDADQDGYIDAVELIYSVPSQYGGSQTWWAYTSMFRGMDSNLSSPNPNQFVFASYDFMYSDPHYIDAHTYIHETGHVLGLLDYYNTSDSTALKKERAAGGIDMMDHNIGDHCAYSKFSLGWVEPKVVTGEGSITIRPMTTTGDCIIVSPKWMGTAFDEYLMIEFHAPIGLNEKDASRNYAKNYPLVMRDYGIKVYHIDSRLGIFDLAKNNEFIEYTTEFENTATTITRLAHSNTPIGGGILDKRLVHLLESSGKNTFIKGANATNATLFKEGSTFGVSTFQSFKFHSGKKLPFVFEITSLNEEEAVITFVKK